MLCNIPVYLFIVHVLTPQFAKRVLCPVLSAVRRQSFAFTSTASLKAAGATAQNKAQAWAVRLRERAQLRKLGSIEPHPKPNLPTIADSADSEQKYADDSVLVPDSAVVKIDVISETDRLDPSLELRTPTIPSLDSSDKEKGTIRSSEVGQTATNVVLCTVDEAINAPKDDEGSMTRFVQGDSPNHVRQASAPDRIQQERRAMVDLRPVRPAMRMIEAAMQARQSDQCDLESEGGPLRDMQLAVHGLEAAAKAKSTLRSDGDDGICLATPKDEDGNVNDIGPATPKDEGGNHISLPMKAWPEDEAPIPNVLQKDEVTPNRPLIAPQRDRRSMVDIRPVWPVMRMMGAAIRAERNHTPGFRTGDSDANADQDSAIARGTELFAYRLGHAEERSGTAAAINPLPEVAVDDVDCNDDSFSDDSDDSFSDDSDDSFADGWRPADVTPAAM